MEVIILLIFLSLFLAGGFLMAFFWAMRNGQYDDTCTPAMRMLFEDNPEYHKQPEPKKLKSTKGDSHGNGII